MIIYMDLCKYKNMFGEPGKGVHTHIMGFAVMDLIFTMFFSLILMLIIKKFIKTELSHSLIFSLLLVSFVGVGEILHKKFCVKN